METNVKRPFWKKWWFWLITAFVFFYMIGSQSENFSGTGTSDKPDPVVNQRPANENEFIRIVALAQQQNSDAKNDMQKGGIKSERDAVLCKELKSLDVKNWTGRIAKIDANSDGKGVLEVEIAKDIYLKTWNNAISDIGSDTLLEPGSPIFKSASAMAKGQAVHISGYFLSGGTEDCLKESSLTLSGKLRDPAFIFRFDSIAVLSNVPTPATAAALPAPVKVEVPTQNAAVAEENDKSTLALKVESETGEANKFEEDEKQMLNELKANAEEEKKLAVSVSDAQATPSFDCEKALSSIEKMICSTPSLATADANMASAYKLAMLRTSNKTELKRSQIAWMKNTRNKCSDSVCVNQSYASRVGVLVKAN